MTWTRWWREQAPQDFLRKPSQLNHPIRHLIVKLAGEKGRSVLDVGCATCIDYPFFKKAGVEYTGLDLTLKFVKRARQLYPGVDVHQGDAKTLKFRDNWFDVVYCKDLLEHMNPPDHRRVITEMLRVARNRVMIGFFLTPHDRPTHVKRIGGEWFYNTYNRPELVNFIKGQIGVADLQIHDRVGLNCYDQPCSLWVIDLQN